MSYLGNWLALGACIYGKKNSDQALKMLELQKRRKSRHDVDIDELIAMRNKGLTLREIAAACNVSFYIARTCLINAGVKLEN